MATKSNFIQMANCTSAHNVEGGKISPVMSHEVENTLSLRLRVRFHAYALFAEPIYCVGGSTYLFVESTLVSGLERVKRFGGKFFVSSLFLFVFACFVCTSHSQLVFKPKAQSK